MKNKGLLRKYTITKADGSPVDANAEYFVLRLDPFGSDYKHTEACRKAVVTYAKEIEKHLPKLSEELMDKYYNPTWKEILKYILIKLFIAMVGIFMLAYIFSCSAQTTKPKNVTPHFQTKNWK